MLGIIKPTEGKVFIDDREYYHTSQVSRDFLVMFHKIVSILIVPL